MSIFDSLHKILKLIDSEKEPKVDVLKPLDINFEEEDFDYPKEMSMDFTSRSNKEAEEEYNNIKKVKVKSPKLWGNWNYLFKPSLAGLDEIKEDDRLYFTFPAGWEMGSSDIEYWYISIPLNGTVDETIEFYTPARIEDVYTG